jgi:hypothetical protein
VSRSQGKEARVKWEDKFSANFGELLAMRSLLHCTSFSSSSSLRKSRATTVLAQHMGVSMGGIFTLIKLVNLLGNVNTIPDWRMN